MNVSFGRNCEQGVSKVGCEVVHGLKRRRKEGCQL